MRLLFIKSLQFFISVINYGNFFHIKFEYLKYLNNFSLQSRFSIQGVVKMAAIFDFAIFLKKPLMKYFHFCWKMICEIPFTSWWKNLRWPFFFHLKNFRHGVTGGILNTKLIITKVKYDQIFRLDTFLVVLLNNALLIKK